MLHGTAAYSDNMVQIVKEELSEFAKRIEATLKEYGLDPEIKPIVYVGGGAVVMRRFGSITGRNIMHIEEVKANAVGYAYLAENQLRRNGF